MPLTIRHFITVHWYNFYMLWFSAGAIVFEFSYREPDYSSNPQGPKEPLGSDKAPPVCKAHLRFSSASLTREVLGRKCWCTNARWMCAEAIISARRLSASDRIHGCCVLKLYAACMSHTNLVNFSCVVSLSYGHFHVDLLLEIQIFLRVSLLYELVNLKSFYYVDLIINSIKMDKFRVPYKSDDWLLCLIFNFIMSSSLIDSQPEFFTVGSLDHVCF